VRCAQKMRRRGGAGKGSGSKGCRGAEHGQACTKDSAGAEGLRAALIRPCNSRQRVNCHAVMANPTQCRDLLQQKASRRGRHIGIHFSCMQRDRGDMETLCMQRDRGVRGSWKSCLKACKHVPRVYAVESHQTKACHFLLVLVIYESACLHAWRANR
jgi:hypothetical protein